MTDVEARETVTLLNRYGLHARPIKMFVDLTNARASAISVSKGGRTVNGKSILEMMTLCAAQGDTLEIVARGDDAAQAVRDLRTLVESKFGEE